MSFRAAIAQIDSRVGNVEYNLQHHLEYIDRAKREGAQLVLFPELSLTGYTLRDLAWETSVDVHRAGTFEALKEQSKSISIVVGFVESGSDHGIYNAAMLLEDGQIKHIHRKIYPPTYGMFEEGRYFSPGQEVRAFDSKFGKFGIIICEDSWHPALPYLLAVDGAQLLFSLTASPTRISGEGAELDNAKLNHEHQRVYARLLSLYILFSNRVGFEDGVNFWGGSVVVDPFGHAIKQAQLFKEDLIVADIDINEVQRARRFSRHFLDEKVEIITKNLQRISQS
jgi:predicted amidohydrolase